MGAHLHSYTKGRQHSTFYLWHQRSEQTHLTSTISHTKDPRSLVETWRIPFWNHTWSKYGIRPYPMPKIQDLLLRLEGFLSGTILDLNMGYYHMNSRSNKNSNNSSILRLKIKLTAPKGEHQHFLHRRRDEHQKCFDATKCMIRREVLKGYPWLQCSVWNTHWCFKITTWRSHIPKGQANRFLF